MSRQGDLERGLDQADEPDRPTPYGNRAPTNNGRMTRALHSGREVEVLVTDREEEVWVVDEGSPVAVKRSRAACM
jgi:hypothetical protein